jgi:hypothetical protein
MKARVLGEEQTASNAVSRLPLLMPMCAIAAANAAWCCRWRRTTWAGAHSMSAWALTPFLWTGELVIQAGGKQSQTCWRTLDERLRTSSICIMCSVRVSYISSRCRLGLLKLQLFAHVRILTAAMLHVAYAHAHRAARRYDTSGFLLQNVRCSKLTLRKLLPRSAAAGVAAQSAPAPMLRLAAFFDRFVQRPPPSQQQRQ